MSFNFNGVDLSNVVFNGVTCDTVYFNGVLVFSSGTTTESGTTYTLFSYTNTNVTSTSWTNNITKTFSGNSGSGLTFRTGVIGAQYDDEITIYVNTFAKITHNSTDICYKYSANSRMQYSSYVNRTVNDNDTFTLKSYRATFPNGSFTTGGQAKMEIKSNTNDSSVIV